eukprot:15124229-Alexandrium_andersonii.AAC.1
MLGTTPPVSAPSPGCTARSAAPPGLGPAIGGLKLLADSRLLKGPLGPLARRRPQLRPAGRWLPTHFSHRVDWS